MAFAILRVAKLKTLGNVAGHGSHVERLRETPNADQERVYLNQRIAGTYDAKADVEARFKATGITPQKNAVVAIDVFISASPEHFRQNHPDDPNWKAFQAKAMEFLRREYGAENVVHAIAHHDETSPHLHAIITPIKTKTVKVGRKVKTERTENRLCARDWLGGDRTTLSKLQTRFADSVKELGLNRGIQGSQANHTEVKQFYTVMKETTSQAKAINDQYVTILPETFVNRVPKPTILDMTRPRQFAQAQVSEAVNGILSRIQQYNHNAEITRRHQLTSLQQPAMTALQMKGKTRQSQAEEALHKLGYRLDKYGQLVNLLDERKNALKATIRKSLSKHTTMDELKADLAQKGVKMGFYGQHIESYQGKNYNGMAFEDGEGEKIWGHELGPDFTTVSILKQLSKVQQERQLKTYHAEFNKDLAVVFKEEKGNESSVKDRLLRALSTGDKGYLSNWNEGEPREFARARLHDLVNMAPDELRTERERLHKLGFDVGKKPYTGFGSH